MSKVTIESILSQIAQLSQSERTQLRQILEKEVLQNKPTKPPLDKRVPPIPLPKDGMVSLRWVSKHAKEYIGQWVALDGERLIAHSTNHHEAFDAAKADGAYLPLIEFVSDPDEIFVNV